MSGVSEWEGLCTTRVRFLRTFLEREGLTAGLAARAPPRRPLSEFLQPRLLLAEFPQPHSQHGTPLSGPLTQPPLTAQLTGQKTPFPRVLH